MKPSKILVAIFVFLVILTSVCFAGPSVVELSDSEKAFIKENPIIKLGADPKFIPYEFFDKDGVYKGIAADYIKLICEKTGLRMEVEKGNTWSEAYEKAVERKLDVLPCVSKTPEREKYFSFSDSYYSFLELFMLRTQTKI